MKRKETLSIAVLILSAFSLLTLSVIYTFAVPSSPYLIVLPEETSDSTLKLGSTYTVSIYTDYDGSDVWSWSFELFFDPAILHGDDVRNGNLIHYDNDTSAVFVPGAFDNTIGMLETTYAFFDYGDGPPITTSGPGTLAYVDFTVVGYGSTDIWLSDSAQQSSKLLDPMFAIIDAFLNPYQIGRGYFRNKYPGDVDGDLYVGSADAGVISIGYGSWRGDPNYNREADFDLDGYIGSADAGILSTNYGTTFTWP